VARILDGLADVVGDYDVFIVDQWGCMHDGERAHPGALDALHLLRETGKPVLLVSNSSRPAPPSIDILRALGFADALYDGMFTAGELARVWLDAARAEGRVRTAWSLLSPPGPTSVLAQMGLPTAPRPEDADVLVVSGITFEAEHAFDDALGVGLERGLPLLCLNPDRVSVQPEGGYALCPGTFAARYADMGGVVRSWGKPGPEIYAAALACAPGWRRGLAIGDSLEHDIAGGDAAGLDTVLITRGIHWPALADAPTDRPDPARLAALCEAEGVHPTFALSALRR
jgi:HAD superfamily hydrolase (TIGR01459 family)